MVRYIQGAQRLGYYPIILTANPGRYDYAAAGGIDIIRVDTGNLDALISECSRLGLTHAIAGITGAQESFYATVGKLCQYFDLPGPNPISIERCCDKFVQRQLLAEAGVPMPAYRMATNGRDVEHFAVDIGFPVILKPAAGSGSMGVRLCRNVNELVEHTRYLLDGKHIWRSSPRILVEEYVQGPQYWSEIAGKEVIGIGTVDFGPPPHFVYREWTFPAPLNHGERERITDISLSCLPALGLGWGPTNVELRWAKRGPVVIEVNPRISGTPTPQLIQLAYGIDLISEHIKLAAGEKWDLRRRHSQQNAIARFLVPECDGSLDWIVGCNRAAAILGVADVKIYVEPKAPIVKKGDFRDCIGHVIAVSPKHGQTKAILQRAIDLIDFSIIPFPTVGGQSPACASADNPPLRGNVIGDKT
ncbi:conserved hypothetical protein [Mesorhizobium plurifarium]|uniref:ATP-grasp domain-containing protein n=1 Tax=Mesorhizobium plurifarium TaxID=69974 RepID=A0A090F8M6_MESPL|nr:conserved hypothetical protein [Mesorhizobium plurifarium]